MEEYTIVANTKGKADVWRHFGLRKRKADETIVEKTAVRVLNEQYCCENVGLYNQYDDLHSSSPSTTFIILHHCPSYN